MKNKIQFKVIYLSENQGHGNARRVSLKECSNNLVALMDADDISLSNRFEKQIEKFISDPSINIVGGQIAEFISTPDNIVGIRYVPENDSIIKQYMKKRCPMNQVTVMMQKDFYNQVGGYIDWYCEEDYYLWLRMALSGGNFANVSDILVNVRIGDEMSSRRGGIKYFKSEVKIQEFMLKEKIIGLPRFLYNVLIRFCGEVLLTNKMRTRLFKIMRKSPSLYKEKILNNEIKNKDNSLIVNCPKFSVAMCVYGGDNASWFDLALDSIIKQTVVPDEIVLVVDGPIPDAIQTVINNYLKICNELN